MRERVPESGSWKRKIERVSNTLTDCGVERKHRSINHPSICCHCWPVPHLDIWPGLALPTMSYYGKAAANPDFLESWQTQLDAIRDIFRYQKN